jgi:hypothetical protein
LVKIKDQIAGVNNLLVLCASSPGQRSWVSEEFGHSVFTHYLLDGLAGGATDGKKGGPVYASNLFQYVRTKTDDWVQRNRADKADNQRPFRQQPMLLPEGVEESALAKSFLIGYGDRAYAGEKAPVLSNLNTDALREAWKRCDGLSEKTPAPWVSTPRLWRRYRELLQRYEQMLRAGETEAAGKLRTTIDGIASRIDDARAAPGAVALSASLSLPAALGRDRTFTDTQLAAIADRKNEEVAAGIKALGGDETVARCKYLGFLVKRISETPGQLADFASKIMSADDGGKNRPSEAHLPVMLQKYEQPGWQIPAAELITLAIKVRQLAEETALSVGFDQGYPYSERLPGGLWKDLMLADRDRRQGEDLLFSATSNHAKAREFIEKAQTGYAEIRKLASPVRTALAIRDVTFSELPGLTDWVALARPAEPTPQKLEALWAEAHNLADRLARLDPLDPNAPPARDVIEALKNEPNGRDLAAQAEIVRKGLEEVASAFSKAVAAEVQSSLQTQTARQQIEYVLAAPSIKFEDRVQLVNRSRNISAKLSRENPLPVPGEAVNEPDLARNQPRLARAIIGDALLNALSDTTTLRRADNLKDDRDPQLGLQLFGHWKKLIGEPDKPTREDPAKTVIPLSWRERMALVAGTATAPPVEPAELSRAERWRSTFRRLANRTELDHWYDEKSQPDFKRLAEMFYRAISDAEFADQAGKLEATRVSGRLSIDTPPEHPLTTERNYTARFAVHGLPESLEPGFVTLTPQLNRADVLRIKSNPAPAPTSLSRDVQEPVELAAINWLDKSPEIPDFALSLNAYYRGQALKNIVAKLPVQPFPDLTISKPPPSLGAEIAARADENLDQGAIAIIFDCSGSMRYENGKDVNIKLPAAKLALKRLQEKIPQGAKVTLWVYGHKDYKGNDPNGIEQLLPMITWDRNDPAIANVLYEKVKDLDAEGVTPLLKTMVKAADEKNFKNYNGFKTLLILTDGCNQEGRDKPDNNAVADQFRKAFVNVDRHVSIRMVLFKVGFGADEEAKAAKIQFADLPSVKLASKLYEATDANKLYEQLAESLRPRVTINHNNRPVFEEFLARHPGEPLGWHPNPPLRNLDNLEAEIRGQHQKIALEHGDQLPLHIRQTPTGISIERLILAKEPSTSNLRPLWGLDEDAAYVLSLVNKRLEESGAMMKAKFALEDRKLTKAEGGTLKVERPRFVWWEFRPIDSKVIPPRSYVTAFSGQPAPTWEVSCTKWPTPRGERVRPAIEVWASSSDPQVADVRTVTGNEPPDIMVHGNAAKIESISVENVDVPSDPSGKMSPKNCLVVRIHAPQGGRYMATLGGTVFSELHRYYFAVNRYTAIFWIPDIKNNPPQLRLISVDEAKSNRTTTRMFRELVD